MFVTDTDTITLKLNNILDKDLNSFFFFFLQLQAMLPPAIAMTAENGAT